MDERRGYLEEEEGEGVKDARDIAREVVVTTLPNWSQWTKQLEIDQWHLQKLLTEDIVAAIEARDAEHAKLEEFMSRQSQTSDRERIKNLEQQLEQATRAIANLRNREADRASRVPSEVIEALENLEIACGLLEANHQTWFKPQGWKEVSSFLLDDVTAARECLRRLGVGT